MNERDNREMNEGGKDEREREPREGERAPSSTKAEAAPPRQAKKLQRVARELRPQRRPSDGERCPPLRHNVTP